MLYLEKLFKQYPDLSREFLVKVEALRLGAGISDEACQEARKKAYLKESFIFTQDRTESAGPAKPHYFVIPPDSACQLRYDPRSPYSVELVNGKFMFCEKNQPVLEIVMPTAPALYYQNLSDGTPIREVVGVMIGDGAFASLMDGCFWKDNLHCGYCDTVPHMAAKQKKNPNYIFHKNPKHIAEAFDLVWKAGLTHMNLTGGAIPDRYDGKTDAEFYTEYLDAISKRTKFPDKFGISFIAKTKDELKRIQATGIKIVAMNLEVWEPRLFTLICPGKDKFIGRDRWIQSLVDAVEIFGWGNVVTNFVAGVEMCKPYGFKKVDEALSSTLAGYEFLMQRGIVPRQDYWCIEENTRLGLDQVPPPSEYFVRLSTSVRDLLAKYKLPPNPYFTRKCNEIDPIFELY